MINEIWIKLDIVCVFVFFKGRKLISHLNLTNENTNYLILIFEISLKTSLIDEGFFVVEDLNILKVCQLNAIEN